MLIILFCFFAYLKKVHKTIFLKKRIEICLPSNYLITLEQIRFGGCEGKNTTTYYKTQQMFFFSETDFFVRYFFFFFS